MEYSSERDRWLERPDATFAIALSAGVDLAVGEGADARAAVATGGDGGRSAADIQLVFTGPFNACHGA
jgi:hypothetical protein